MRMELISVHFYYYAAIFLYLLCAIWYDYFHFTIDDAHTSTNSTSFLDLQVFLVYYDFWLVCYTLIYAINKTPYFTPGLGSIRAYDNATLIVVFISVLIVTSDSTVSEIQFHHLYTTIGFLLVDIILFIFGHCFDINILVSQLLFNNLDESVLFETSVVMVRKSNCVLVCVPQDPSLVAVVHLDHQNVNMIMVAGIVEYVSELLDTVDTFQNVPVWIQAAVSRNSAPPG